MRWRLLVEAWGVVTTLALLSISSCSSDRDPCETGASCVALDDCGIDAVCVGTKCVTQHCLENGASCGAANGACESGLCSGPPDGDRVCATGPQPDGWNCTSSTHCSSGDCNGGSFTCVARGSATLGDSCEQDTDCVAELICLHDPCASPEGTCSTRQQNEGPCCAWSDCQTGSACLRDPSCDPNAPRHCGGRYLPGEPCCTHDECSSTCDFMTSKCQ